MRLIGRAAIAMLMGAAACASVVRPPGGPVDHDPPEIVSVSIDTNAVNVTAKAIDVQFDEVVSDHPAGGVGFSAPVTLDGIVLLSPSGTSAKVSWHRERITIEPRGAFRANTTYRVTLLPGIADLRGNVRKEATSFVFSTGPSIATLGILGRIFDWKSTAVASNAMIEATLNPGKPDSLIYRGTSDTTGQFEVGPLTAGHYLLRGYIDADNNRALGPLERWDTVSVDVTDRNPVTELRAIQRDTAPIGIQGVDVIDSMWIRIRLDKPFDPRAELRSTLVSLKRADSSTVDVAAIMTETQGAFIRKQSDTTHRDSTAAPARAILGETPPTRPPGPRPSFPPPEQAVVVHLAPGSAITPDGRYSVTLRGLPNLVGHIGSATFGFVAPKPPPVRPPPR